MKSVRWMTVAIAVAMFLAMPALGLAEDKPADAPKAEAPAAAPADAPKAEAPAAAPADAPKAEAPAPAPQPEAPAETPAK